MRTVVRWAARAVAVVGLLASGTAVPAPGAWAATPFAAAGDAELIPGLKIAQAQNIFLSYGLPKVEIDLPRDLFAEVSSVRASDAADDGLPCEVFPDQAAYVCGNGSAKQPVIGVLFLYVVPQVRPGTGNLYPQTYDVGVLDPGSRARATVHATLRPEVDLALLGPYAATDGGHGAAITVYAQNLGPSDAQGATVTLSFSGAYTTFGLPAACTASGAVATCTVAELPAGQQVPVSVALGAGTGVISVLGRVSGPDEELDHGNNAGVGGPWNLFPGNGSAAAVPPAPPAVPARGIPLPVPVSGPASGAVAPVPVEAPSATTAPARAAAATATPAWARDLAVVFLCVSSVYLATAGAVWLRRRWRAS